jgi:hypothetical protein
MIYAGFTSILPYVPYGMLYSLIEDLMVDAGRRIKEHVEATAEAYRKLKEIRSVSVTAQ